MKLKVGDKVRVKTMQELSAKYGRPHQGVCGATVVVPGAFNFTSAMEPYGVRSKWLQVYSDRTVTI